MTAPASLADLTRRGEAALAHFLERDHPPQSAVEWLGIAVAQLPDLTARARTADEVHGWSRTQSVRIRAPLFEALVAAIGSAAALIDQARRSLVERYPDCEDADADPEDYAVMLEAAHRTAPRRAEMMIGAYTSFLGGAIEAAGSLAEAEVAIAQMRRWERIDPGRTVEVRSAQLHGALSNVLGGLLAYARLIGEDADQLTD